MKEFVKSMAKGSSLTCLKCKEDLRMESLETFLKENDLFDGTFKLQIKTFINCTRGETQLPFLTLKKRNAQDPHYWEYDSAMTSVYLDVLSTIAKDGLTFAGRKVLITGCGRDSIGVEILKALLSGGAQIVITTSRFSKEVTEYYRSIYELHGSKGSRLVCVPFNGGSLQDVKAFCKYIYDNESSGGLGWDLDIVIPFAAISEVGREIDGIDGKSELAHRVMLTNVLRLIGEIKFWKHSLNYNTRPAAVLLPFSPNHGTFGQDGLYGESKLGLETLMNRFHSESWGDYLTIIGAVIGWTRGTGLMAGNNLVAEGIEKLGARTFSTHEMAFSLVGLLHPLLIAKSLHEPILVRS